MYKTKDLYEAACIYATENKLIKLERDANRNIFWFIFEKNCQEIAERYWQNEISVKAKSYADAIRTLKDRVFSQKEL